jgi:hypothetical protein
MSSSTKLFKDQLLEPLSRTRLIGPLTAGYTVRPLLYPVPESDRGPPVQFAQFKNGGLKIELFTASTKDTSFFAISHVWGKAEWRTVSCVGWEILASTQKARFVEERLYGLVAEVPFWMDIITINQRDKAEAISTVQAIPAIFRDAEKTIAIREGDGLYRCCAETAKNFTEYEETNAGLVVHAVGDPSHDIFKESYLARLWTLQECLLSHTIDFIVVTDGENQDCTYRILC